MEKLYYCRESERVFSENELRDFYAMEAGHDFVYSCGFETWIENSLFRNNGTLEEINCVLRESCNGRTIFEQWNLYSDL